MSLCKWDWSFRFWFALGCCDLLLGGVELLSFFTNHGSLKCALFLSSSPPCQLFWDLEGFALEGLGPIYTKGTFGLSFKTVAVGVVVSWFFLAYRGIRVAN